MKSNGIIYTEYLQMLLFEFWYPASDHPVAKPLQPEGNLLPKEQLRYPLHCEGLPTLNHS